MTDALAPTELGQLLEAARKTAGISGRTAAARSGISATRWRQIVSGEGGRPPAPTVVAAALGVGADPAQALQAAGLPHDPATLTAVVDELARAREKARTTTSLSGLADEIERIRALPLPAAEKLRVAQGVIALFEEMAREDQAAEPVE
jgi:transcriptional regulator with XRE-family HTH domain